MKTLLALFLLTIASTTFAMDSCTYSVKDRYGYEYENHTRLAYDRYEACREADYACRVAVSEGQRNGRYMDAFCEENNIIINPNRPPLPPTSTITCTTDIVDYYNVSIRSFTGYGQTQGQACAQSEEFCNYELSRNTNQGWRCLTRGTNGGGGNPYPQPRPPRYVTETCRASRFDPAGYFVQSYLQTHTGPEYTDVKGQACSKAYGQCQNDIRGRQVCRIDG